MIPPSPKQPRFLEGKKENVAALPSAPGRPVVQIEPAAWAASSNTGTPSACISATGATLPNRCTAMTAFVRGVSTARTVSAVTQNVAGSTSSLADSQFVDTFPFPVTLEVLEHGRDRYMIYCVVCHDSLGTGRGKIVERGYTPPPSYHIERLRHAPVGHFFDVITNGYGSMPDYREQVPPLDRWAIVAYIRALNRSQNGSLSDVPEALRGELNR